MSLFSNRYVVAFCVPVGVLLIGVLAKKVTRATRGWQRDDFYLGFELALAAIAGDLDYLLGLAGGRFSGAVAPLIFLVAALVSLLWLIAERQDWATAAPSFKQIFRLCFLSNVVGGGLLVAFILLVKGIKATT